jgi:hypothetical protein
VSGSLLPIILAAILRWHPDAPSADQDRYAEIAQAIADEATAAPLWTAVEPSEGEAAAVGLPPAAPTATALLLATVAQHESGFLESVRRCKRRGDQGRSIGLYQLMSGRAWRGHRAADICADDHLQARLALQVLQGARAQCRTCALTFVLRQYASGDGGKSTPAATRLAAMFALAASRTGLDVAVFSPDAPPRWN